MGIFFLQTHSVGTSIESPHGKGRMELYYSGSQCILFSTRDADRLENGNTLITAANRFIEVTPQGDIVWQFRLKDVQFTSNIDAASTGVLQGNQDSCLISIKLFNVSSSQKSRDPGYVNGKAGAWWSTLQVRRKRKIFRNLVKAIRVNDSQAIPLPVNDLTEIEKMYTPARAS